MGELTLATFRTELQFLLKQRTDSAVATDRLTRWVNWAYRHVSQPKVYEHRELQTNTTITLVLNDFDYDISEGGGIISPDMDILKIYNVCYVAAAAYSFTARHVDLKPVPIQRYRTTKVTADQPAQYCLHGDQLLVSPGPNATAAGNILYLDVYREPAALSANGSQTVLPDYWDEAVLLGARWRAERDLGYAELAEESKHNYAALVNDLGGDSTFILTSDTGHRPGLYRPEHPLM